jgi:predicted DNA-binding protein
MSTNPQPANRPKPPPPKKRYSVLLPQELAERFERVAGLRLGSKSAIVEEALDRRLNPEKYPFIGDALLRRLDDQSRTIATLRRDTVIIAEMLSLFVRYFLTIAPPLGEREQQPARALGKDRRRQMLRTAFGPTIAAALTDPTVLEVMVNPDGRLWIDRAAAGRADSGHRLGAAETERIIRLVAAHVRREVTDKAPIVSAELPDTGERFEGVMPPVATAPCFSIASPPRSPTVLPTTWPPAS